MSNVIVFLRCRDVFVFFRANVLDTQDASYSRKNSTTSVSFPQVHWFIRCTIYWTVSWIVLLTLYFQYTSKRVQTGKMSCWSDDDSGVDAIADVNEWSCVDNRFCLFDESNQLANCLPIASRIDLLNNQYVIEPAHPRSKLYNEAPLYPFWWSVVLYFVTVKYMMPRTLSDVTRTLEMWRVVAYNLFRSASAGNEMTETVQKCVRCHV